MRRAAELLARLERHALDERRLALAARTAELERRQAEITALDRRLEIEHALAFELPGGPQPLAGYARAALAQGRVLRNTEASLRRAVAELESPLRERLRAWKALDLVVTHLRDREAETEMRAARHDVEEAAALRTAAAQNSGASVTSRPSSAGPNLIWQDSRELSRTSNASSSIMLSSELATSSRGSQSSPT